MKQSAQSALQSLTLESELYTGIFRPFLLYAGSFKAKKPQSEMNGSVIPLVCQMVPFCERWLCFGQPGLERGIKIPARHNKEQHYKEFNRNISWGNTGTRFQAALKTLGRGDALL